MITLFKKNSPVAALVLLAAIFLVLLGDGFGLACMGGFFTGKNEVTQNDERIANLPSPPPTSETTK